MPPPFAAYLRVYEPLVAFDRDDQYRWRRYFTEGRAVAPVDGPAHQHELVRTAVGVGWTKLPDLPEHAYVMEGDGTLLVCPWNLRVRMAEAALAARSGVPAALADAFVPVALADAAEQVLAEWRSAGRAVNHGSPRLHEYGCGWTVPLRWFAFFDLDERELAVDGDARYLRYRTTMSRARRRAHRALAVLRRSAGDTAIAEAVEEGTRWLEGFHARSMVELDYGGLTRLLTDEKLRADDSPGLAAAALAALARSDMMEATEAYEQLVERWRAVQLLERSN